MDEPHPDVKRVDFLGDEHSPNEHFTQPESKLKGVFIVTELYRILMVAAAMLVCVSHGANDVANAITPLLISLQAHGEDGSTNNKGYWVGGIGIAAGVVILGSRVMETIGKKVVKLNFVVGFCAQFATAIAVILGTLLGLPLSTTHCMVGSLFGVVLARKLNFVKFAYVCKSQEEEVEAWLKAP